MFPWIVQVSDPIASGKPEITLKVVIALGAAAEVYPQGVNRCQFWKMVRPLRYRLAHHQSTPAGFALVVWRRHAFGVTIKNRRVLVILAPFPKLMQRRRFVPSEVGLPPDDGKVLLDVFRVGDVAKDECRWPNPASEKRF